ncbi:MAG: hypothetical protein Fur0010_25980 [Bdellovibrio sp.]
MSDSKTKMQMKGGNDESSKKREREKKLKQLTPKEREEFFENEKKQEEQWQEDCKLYPELFSFFYDSGADANDRRLGISPLSKEARAQIRKKFENGEYPERLHHFVQMQLSLKEKP